MNKNNKSVPSDAAEADRGLQQKLPTSRRNNAKPHVVSRFSCPEGTIEIIERTYPLNVDFNNPMFKSKRVLLHEGEPIAFEIHPVQS